MSSARTFPDVTLDDCAREPIHIPGSIQSHGALLAFDSSRLSFYSVNAPQVLERGLALGVGVADLDDGHPLLHGLASDVASATSLQHTSVVVSSAGGRSWSRAVHRHDQRVIVEFEEVDRARWESPAPARLFARIKASPSSDAMLQTCCDEIRAWTGFDRVMGYVFLPDDSGEVVAQSRADGVDSFFGMRFPAGDIPAQARALYVRNTLRFIADVDGEPQALIGPDGSRPLDLSGATLRSVSPIHLEYLRNMGVRASMSVSIVLGGKLWGLFACHHSQPLRVPLPTREACDMVAHFAAARVQAMLADEKAARVEESAALTSRLGGEFARADDALQYLQASAEPLMQLLECDALVLSYRGRIVSFGPIAPEIGVVIARHFLRLGVDMAAIDDRQRWPAELHERLGPWIGALAIDFDPANGGRLIALRQEQVTTVRWAGRPDKVVSMGPNGTRLTPRGSFAEWRENVRGRSVAWSSFCQDNAALLRSELSRAAAARHAEIEEARRHLLAMLGHDLRDPLQAIRMAAGYLKTTGANPAIGRRIDNSSGRMQSLIAQVMDFSRAEAGLPLLSQRTETDLAALLEDLVDEARTANPLAEFDVAIERPALGVCDPTRLSQAVGNLLSNARQHAAPGTSIGLSLRVRDAVASFEISNVADPINREVVRMLFDPFKRTERAKSNVSGLGLGLFIAYRIAEAMHGTIEYAYRDGRVTFTLTADVSGTKDEQPTAS